MKSRSTSCDGELDLAGVRHDELHAVVDPVALEGAAELARRGRRRACRPRRSECRSYDQSSTPAAARSERDVLPPLNRPISTNGPLAAIAREPVEQRRLVELQRRDPVVELAAREEEGEILEPPCLLWPGRDVGKALRPPVRCRRGVEYVLPGCGADGRGQRPLNRIPDHGQGYTVNVDDLRWSTLIGASSRSRITSPPGPRRSRASSP